MSKFWKARNVDPYDTDSDSAEYFGLVPTLPYGYSSKTIEHQAIPEYDMAMRSAEEQRQEVRWFVAEFLQVPFSTFGLAVNRSSNYIGVIINGGSVSTKFADHIEALLGLDMGFVFFADRPRPHAKQADTIRKKLGLASAKRHHLTKSSPVDQEDEQEEDDDEDFVSWKLKNGTTIEIAGPPDIIEPVKNAIRDGLLRITLSYRENLSL